MRWLKRGLLIEPPVHLPWSTSHAAVPHVQENDGSLDVYFTTRDDHRRSHIAVARVDLEGGRVEVAPDPVLVPGQLGAFDDSGVMTSCLVRNGDQSYLYYQGWSLGVTVPFYVFGGCAISERPGAPLDVTRSTRTCAPHRGCCRTMIAGVCGTSRISVGGHSS